MRPDAIRAHASDGGESPRWYARAVHRSGVILLLALHACTPDAHDASASHGGSTTRGETTIASTETSTSSVASTSTSTASADTSSAGTSSTGASTGESTGGDTPPSYTPRQNVRYVSPAGDDAQDGMTIATAWHRVDAHIEAIPEDTEVVFLEGIHDGYTTEIYSSYGDRPLLPPHITLRAESYRGATIVGPGTPDGDTGGNAFTIEAVGGNVTRDLEIWGLVLTGWMDQYGNGVVSVHGDVDGLRIVGNDFHGNGSGSLLDHTIYLSGGETQATAPRNLAILHNDVDEPGGNGAFVHVYIGPGEQFAPHDWVAADNVVRGTQTWGFILDPNFVAPANIEIHDNDVRLVASAAIVDFWYGDATGKNGVDDTCVVHHNLFVNDGDGNVVKRQAVSTGSPHAPVLHDNRYWSSTGGIVLDGIEAGDGDVIGPP